MASTQSLSATSHDRKARLAQLKSLKRKKPDSDESNTNDEPGASDKTESEDGASKYLSGRNYNIETKGAKLGFEVAPSDGHETLEHRASALEKAVKAQAEEETKTEQPLDLFTIQPKKPNWDLKRDLDRKMAVLNVRTDNAIARLVRERIAKQQASTASAHQIQAVNGGSDGEVVGMDGTSLVEATHLREREDEEETRREQQEEAEADALLDV